MIERTSSFAQRPEDDDGDHGAEAPWDGLHDRGFARSGVPVQQRHTARPAGAGGARRPHDRGEARDSLFSLADVAGARSGREAREGPGGLRARRAAAAGCEVRRGASAPHVPSALRVTARVLCRLLQRHRVPESRPRRRGADGLREAPFREARRIPVRSRSCPRGGGRGGAGGLRRRREDLRRTVAPEDRGARRGAARPRARDARRPATGEGGRDVRAALLRVPAQRSRRHRGHRTRRPARPAAGRANRPPASSWSWAARSGCSAQAATRPRATPSRRCVRSPAATTRNWWRCGWRNATTTCAATARRATACAPFLDSASRKAEARFFYLTALARAGRSRRVRRLSRARWWPSSPTAPGPRRR